MFNLLARRTNRPTTSAIALVIACGLGISACASSDQSVASKSDTAPNQNVPAAKPACTDIYLTWNAKPNDLEFVGCTDGKSAQIRTLNYNYEVPGSKAKAIETVLVETYKMAPLAFVCCGWEPRPAEGSLNRLGTFRNAEGFYYQISMSSGETLEKDWSNIPKFSITVELFLDVV